MALAVARSTLSLLLAFVFPVVNGAATTPDLPALAGHSLPEALRVLQDHGWPLLFSSRLVRDTMRVVDQPVGANPAAVLADLLRPHGLAVREGARDRLVIVAAPRRRATRPVAATRSGTAPLTPQVAPAATVREEIVVIPGRDLPRGASPPSSTLDLDDGRTAPRLGDDVLGGVSVLPGASSPEGSARLSVRGAGDDEVLVLLDGLELVAPYHLGDFDGAVSLMAPSSVERADLFTGAYPAQYGSRIGGVVDLTTRMPTRDRHFSLGLDLLHTEGAASGAFGERNRWLATARTGSYEWPLELSGRDQHPRYWDAFGKVDLELGGGQSLSADVLVARDDFELSSEHSDDESYRSGWDNRYVWARHIAVLGRELYADTVAGSGRVGRDRAGAFDLSGSRFSARERRYVDLSSVRQDWHWEAGHHAALKWGFELDRSDTTLDFWSDRDLAGSVHPLLDEPSSGFGGVREDFDSTHGGAYVSTQLQPLRALSLELGLRHDTVGSSDQGHLSPRLAAAWELGPSSTVRAAWGWFHQSQRPYDLQIDNALQNGLVELASERAEQRVLSFEHRLEHGTTLLIEAYQRRLDHPRVRFENLFDPLLPFPELSDYRVRVAPESGTAEGVELTLRRPLRRRWGWWASYVRSSVVDEVESQGRIPRSNDQPHALRAGASYRAGRGFELGLLWQYHTGWPTTAVEVRQIAAADGASEWIAFPGPRNGERLPDYHRLDLRAGRSWSLRLGRLSAHLDLLDVYDRRNLRGFEDLRLVPDPRGGVEQSRRRVTWTGFVPSVGVRWEL